jgi:very-short-patch-repair endonuclease
MLIDFLRQIPPATVQTAICEDVLQVVTEPDIPPQGEAADFRIVTQCLRRLGTVDAILEEALTQLAQAALSLYPNWYASAEPLPRPASPGIEEYLQHCLALSRLAAFRREISQTWLKDAAACCHHRQLPLLKSFPRAVQIAQLALAIHRERLYLVLALEDRQATAGFLFGLSRAAEWIARQTGAPVAVLIPRELAAAPELESILYRAYNLEPERPHPVASPIEETRHLIYPIEGGPHPGSPGEQRLAERLAQEPDLAPLFRFNQWVRTQLGSSYLVDLLWQQGKVVVEIDGYKYHSTRSAFHQDRQRDYELTISDHLVLRVAHDEVLGEMNSVIQKIRRVVTYRKKQMQEKG